MTFLEGFHYLAKWEIQLGEVLSHFARLILSLVARGIPPEMTLVEFPHPRVPRRNAGTENNLAQGKNI